MALPGVWKSPEQEKGSLPPLLVSFIHSGWQQSPCICPGRGKKREGWRHKVLAGSEEVGTPLRRKRQEGQGLGPAKEKRKPKRQPRIKQEPESRAASRKPPPGLRAQAASTHLGSSKGRLQGPCPQALSPPLFYEVCRKTWKERKNKKRKEEKEQKLKIQNPIDPALKPSAALCQLCDSGASVTSGKWEQKWLYHLPCGAVVRVK